MYKPKPIDTHGIELPSEINELVMMLAASVHDTWAVGKIEKGYRYGEVTSDAEKTHCDLKPFPELSEGTQSYDVNTVLASVKGLYALGYEIVKTNADGIPDMLVCKCGHSRLSHVHLNPSGHEQEKPSWCGAMDTSYSYCTCQKYSEKKLPYQKHEDKREEGKEHHSIG